MEHAELLRAISDLRLALQGLFDADRGFLGSDNWCGYCERAQKHEEHAPDCVITKAQSALRDTVRFVE